jgi:hypothetical protein
VSTTWTYWISRDSANGVLYPTCKLWAARPNRTRYGTRVLWRRDDEQKGLLIGIYALSDIERWFGSARIPETDIQLFKVEMGVTERMRAGAKR